MDLNTQLKPTVVSNPHPLIGDGRVNYYEGFKAGETLWEYVTRVGVEIPRGSFVVIINGCVAMHDWRLYVLQEGDDIIFRSSALGGGGGGKVLRLVAMVALSVAAVAVGGWAAGAMNFAKDSFAFGLASSLVGAAVMIGGTMLINAILPPPKPQVPSLTDKEQSPTYGISAGRNQANPYGPMLLVFGRHKVVPFLASKIYTTFDGDDQYLSQAFHFGLQPDLNLEKIRIGDTDVTAYQNVQVEKSSDNGRLSLVAGNVDALEGFEVYKSSGWVSRTTPNDTTHISIDIASNLFDIADNGDERTISVNLILQYKKTSSTTWLPLSGGSVNLSGKNPQKPTRLTINQYVDKGQYDIRISKASEDISTTRKSNKVTIAQIRCTQEDSADYSGQLRVAVKIKATSQLNGAIDELSAIASAKCQVWNGGAWEVKETSNPAWWFLWWARGKRDANFKRLYGECLPDNRIDIEAIKAWAAFCDRKKLSFNWVLDRKMSVEEVYYTIARAGRASTTWQTGKRGVIWDSDELPVTTLLTPANIIAGSFSYKHINTDVADEIILNYYDANKDWEKAVVRQKVPNATQANNPITLDLEGCTNESQAGREANLLAASQQLHRKQYSFEMDIEGAVLTRGDVAQLTHDLTSFAAGGRLVTVNGNVLTLDADVGTATNAWLTLRSPFNKMYNVRVNAKGNQLTLVNGWTFGDVGNVEDWLWQYDPSKIAGVKLQIKSVVPQSNGNIRFEAIEYSSDYFAAENNVYFAVPQKQARDLPAISVFDALATERVLNEQNGDTEVTISWVMSELADASVVIRRGRDVLFNDNVHGSAVSVVARESDTLDVEIVPFADRRTSRVFNKSFVVIGTNVIVPAPTGLKIIGAFTKSVVTIKWDRVINAVGYEVQVLSGSTVRRTVRVGDVLTYTYAFADMSQDGGAVRSLTFKVRALGQRSAKSSWVSVSGKNPQVAALQGIKIESNIKSLIFTCEKPQDEDFAGYLVWISDNKSFVPTLANVSHDGSFNQVFFNGFNGQPLEQKDYYIWCAGYDAFGKDELNISGYFVAQPAILKLDPQSIAAEMIQDGALTMTKFAQGIKPPRIVQELPTTGELNDLVVLESTSTMYRWDGARWNSQDVVPPDGSITNAKLANGAVNSSKIASGAVTNGAIANGAITNAKLGNGSVSSTKLANGSVGNAHLQENSVGSNQLQVSSIVAEKIADNAVSASKIINNAISNAHLQSNSVSTANIVANAINNSHLQTGSVTTDKIASNSINTGHLQSNIINASHIQTGSITASKLAVMGDNLILDPSFDDIDYWQTAYFRSFTKEIIDGKVWGKAVVDRTVSTAGGWAGAIEIKRTFDVKEGDEYLLSIDIWIEDGGQIRYNPPTIIFYKADNLSTAIWGGEVILDNNQYPLQAGQKYTIIKSIKVPSGCSKAKFYNSFSALTNQTTVTATIRYSNPTIRLRSSGELIVDGGIVSRHITTGAIMTDHIQVGAVGGTQISNNAISTQHIQSNAITTDLIQVGAVGQTQIKPNSINTGHLIAGSVTAPIIAAGAVGADQIAAGAISAKHLLVGDMSNIVTNGDQRFGLDGYISSGMSLSDPDSGSPTGRAIKLNVRDSQYGTFFPVSSGELYYVKFSCYRSGVANTVAVGLQVRNKSNTTFAWLYPARKVATDPNSWTTHEGILTIPDGGVTARVYLLIEMPNTSNETTAYLSGIEVRRVSGSTMIADGTITTQKLRVGEIEGNVIKANTLNGDKIIGNSIHGDKITAGTIAANKLNVNQLSAITSNLGSVNAGSININNKFLVDSGGNVSIRNATSGARMVINNNRIEVYDSNNRLRVRMGIW